jgi:hypothetical protein
MEETALRSDRVVRISTNNGNHSRARSDSDHEDDELEEKDYDMRCFEFGLGEETVIFNPIVTFLAIAILWGLTIWAMSKYGFLSAHGHLVRCPCL